MTFSSNYIVDWYADTTFDAICNIIPKFATNAQTGCAIIVGWSAELQLFSA